MRQPELPTPRNHLGEDLLKFIGDNKDLLVAALVFGKTALDMVRENSRRPPRRKLTKKSEKPDISPEEN